MTAVVVPVEVPAVVSALVEARAGRSWRRHLARLTSGSHFGLAGQLRREAAWVLGQLGYTDAVIAQALGVGRAAIRTGRRAFEGRLAADAQLRDWFEAIVSPGADAPVARAA